MIVQSEAPDGSHLVLTMEEHTATGAVLAQHFGGTDLFDRPEPQDLFAELVAEHDRGWMPIDELVVRDPRTDLPCSVYEAPLAHSLTAGVGTIDYNESCHPYRGLLASMHIAGLYNGRFGMNEPKALDALTEDEQARLAGFLDSEHTRRERLRSQLTADPDAAPWIEPDVLMKSYKALQFFDRLALWLQVTHPRHRSPTVLNAVAGRDCDYDVHISQVTDERVRLDPFPFDTDGLTIAIAGRQLWPQPAASDLITALERAPTALQQVVFIS